MLLFPLTLLLLLLLLLPLLILLTLLLLVLLLLLLKMLLLLELLAFERSRDGVGLLVLLIGRAGDLLAGLESELLIGRVGDRPPVRTPPAVVFAAPGVVEEPAVGVVILEVVAVECSALRLLSGSV
jgi:hypothetical protein